MPGALRNRAPNTAQFPTWLFRSLSIQVLWFCGRGMGLVSVILSGSILDLGKLQFSLDISFLICRLGYEDVFALLAT